MSVQRISVRILGSGRIPRLGTLAPCPKPYPVTLEMLKAIIVAPNLRVMWDNPDTHAPIQVVPANCEKIFKMALGETSEAPTPPPQMLTRNEQGKRVARPIPPGRTVAGTVREAGPLSSTPAPGIPYAMIKGENDVMISTGVTLEDLASGSAKGKANWLVPHDGGWTSIPSKWVEEEPAPDPLPVVDGGESPEETPVGTSDETPEEPTGEGSDEPTPEAEASDDTLPNIDSDTNNTNDAPPINRGGNNRNNKKRR